MATAEIVRDSSATSAERVVSLAAETLQGSTQEFRLAAGSSQSPVPVFFAPQHDRQELNGFWGTLVKGTLRAVYTIVAHAGGSSAAWDRLKLELMRIAHLPNNWDGEGAEQLSPETVKTAAALVDLARIATESSNLLQCPVPGLFPSAEGGIAFKWIRRNKELKCTVMGNSVEVLRWSQLDAYGCDGLWDVPVQQVSEHFAWLLR